MSYQTEYSDYESNVSSEDEVCYNPFSRNQSLQFCIVVGEVTDLYPVKIKDIFGMTAKIQNYKYFLPINKV